MNQTKTFSDFFSGIGLVQKGLEQSNWEHLFSLDYSEKKHKLYKANFSADSKYVVQDIYNTTQSEVPNSFLIHASFPCTDVSAAGPRTGSQDGKESSAIDSFLRIISDKGPDRPPLVMLENVKGLLSSHKGQDLFFLLKHLNNFGYYTDLLSIDAKFFVPQSRERLFIIGINSKYFNVSCGSTTDDIKPSDARDKSVIKFIKEHATLNWYFHDLPSLPHKKTKLLDVIEEENDAWWSQSRTQYLLSQMFPRHLDWLNKHKDDDAYSYATAFRRMRDRDGERKSTAEVRTDGIAGCLRTSKGGSAKQILLRCGKGNIEARLLSVKECARLMGAGDFVIPDEMSTTDALSCFGDAVCADVVSWIDKHYLSPLFESVRCGTEVKESVTTKMEKETSLSGSDLDRIEAEFNRWATNNLDPAQKLPYKGRIYSALIALSNIETGNWETVELSEAKSTDEGKFFSKRSIKNHTSHRISLVLSTKKRSHLIPSNTSTGELGRTSAGTKDAGLQFIRCIHQILQKLNSDKHSAAIEKLFELNLNVLEQYFELGGIEVPFSHSETKTSYINKLINAHAGNLGAVLQHMVGAKLELRYRGMDLDILHHSYSTADKQTNRLGDFEIGNTVFHVTKTPTADHYRKCYHNSQSGRQVYLLIPDKLLDATKKFAENECGNDFTRKVNTFSIEQFLSQNIDEIGKFDNITSLHTLEDLLNTYNTLVDSYERDKSLRIVIPDFGHDERKK